ncbi:MAG TPA: Ig-like domain-containing protein [Nannocystaceae bacterium]|nr:Ig-like domain-containing protein [Nannocystaceae bacterium]
MNCRSLMLPAIAVALFSTTARADMPNEDESPPTVSFVSPTDQQMFTGTSAMVTIEVSAVDEDSGVSRVVVSVDGVDQPEITQAPYVIESVTLPAGMHEISAIASNGDGYPSQAVTIHVVVFPGDDESSGGSEESSTTAELNGDAGVDNNNDDKGGCTVGRERSLMGSGIAFALAVFAGLRLRRRE